jgi:ABC-2 type transport system permease protein
MEEKQSRVLEIIVSSVRPFELLMGKVLGIGAMGLLQMGAWAGILLLLTMSAGGIISLFLNPADFNLPVGAGQEELLAAADFALPSFQPSLFIWFLLFFFGGYLLYASLFAAVGSTVEHQQDAQALMLPLTALIIIPILFITVIVESPNTTLSVVLSLIPFFSPILMIVRIAVTAVPFWQVLASFLLLCGTFVGAVWVSSRIYRVGILMYGKRPTIKDLVRWFAYQ